jgi:hypothetical protein
MARQILFSWGDLNFSEGDRAMITLNHQGAWLTLPAIQSPTGDTRNGLIGNDLNPVEYHTQQGSNQSDFHFLPCVGRPRSVGTGCDKTIDTSYAMAIWSQSMVVFDLDLMAPSQI